MQGARGPDAGAPRAGEPSAAPPPCLPPGCRPAAVGPGEGRPCPAAPERGGPSASFSSRGVRCRRLVNRTPRPAMAPWSQEPVYENLGLCPSPRCHPAGRGTPAPALSPPSPGAASHVPVRSQRGPRGLCDPCVSQMSSPRPDSNSCVRAAHPSSGSLGSGTSPSFPGSRPRPVPTASCFASGHCPADLISGLPLPQGGRWDCQESRGGAGRRTS